MVHSQKWKSNSKKCHGWSMPFQQANPSDDLIRDRDSILAQSFDAAFATEGIKIRKTAPQCPRMHAHAERRVKTVRSRELFDRTLILNERHLRQVLHEYLAHYNTARPHRALAQLS